MWDFYETFHEDAVLASKVLEIALTSRDRGSDNPIPMAGVPYHSAEKYISRLVKAWYKVAIAEQMGAVIPWQIVKREVVSVLTPWTYIDEQSWSNQHFLVSLAELQTKDGNLHLAWGDITLGQYYTKSFESVESVIHYMQKISAQEVLIDIDVQSSTLLKDALSSLWISVSMSSVPHASQSYLEQYLGITHIQSYWKALESWRLQALAMLFSYIEYAQKSSHNKIFWIQYVNDQHFLQIDDVTLKNLEIFRSSYEWSVKYSLYGVLDSAKTAMGKRYLQDLLLYPTTNQEILQQRLDLVQYYLQFQELAKELLSLFSNIGDIQRLISTLLYKKLTSFLFVRLKSYLNILLESQVLCDELLKHWMSTEVLSKNQEFLSKLHYLLRNEWFSESSDYINDWVDPKIDELRKIAYHSDELLLEYQRELVSYTGLSLLKIKYISNQWYYIEVTKKDAPVLESMIKPDDENFEFMRRQTLKTAERYVTPYLETLQYKIISAKDNLEKLEKSYLEWLKQNLFDCSASLEILAVSIAKLDHSASHALLSSQNHYCRPVFHSQDYIDIKEARHPVIEEHLDKTVHFVPNDLQIAKWGIHLITWPNMWGKSTYLRQNALIVYMAYCWLYVCAESANIPYIDAVFARVWSGDLIAKNQSTFMTEMIELSNILHNATQNSFIILDELGRGTSTYDGLAIAKAVIHFLAKHIWAKTLFATHYHELIALDKDFPVVKNFSVSVYETDTDVVFLKKIAAWGADRSYGIEVAKLAWIPSHILSLASGFLKDLESQKKTLQVVPLFGNSSAPVASSAMPASLKKSIDSLNVSQMTPLEALNALDWLLKELKKLD